MADFEKAVNYVLENEDSTLSGKVTIDAGGRTRFGIAEKFHPSLPSDFFDASATDVLEEAKEIYRYSYWYPISGGAISSDAVAAKVLDMVVNMGLHQGIVLVQRALNQMGFGLGEDGALGDHTLAAIEASEPDFLIGLLCDACTTFYRHRAAVVPEDQKYLNGWLTRSQRVPQFAERLSSSEA